MTEALAAHFRLCRIQRERYFVVMRAAATLRDFVATRIVTTAVALSTAGGLIFWLL